jgi:hypothetical protein
MKFKEHCNREMEMTNVKMFGSRIQMKSTGGLTTTCLEAECSIRIFGRKVTKFAQNGLKWDFD